MILINKWTLKYHLVVCVALTLVLYISNKIAEYGVYGIRLAINLVSSWISPNQAASIAIISGADEPLLKGSISDLILVLLGNGYFIFFLILLILYKPTSYLLLKVFDINKM